MNKKTKQLMRPLFLKSGFLLFVIHLLVAALPVRAEEERVLNVQPLPDITVTCDFWFPYNPNDPNSNINDFDNIFGKILVGTTSGRDSINIVDRVCPLHPRFNEFAPPSQFDDPCYDNLYRMYWGKDGYVLGYGNVPLEQIIEPNLHCGQGEIVRKWRQYGSSYVVTEQRIKIINCKEFYVPSNCWRFTGQDVGTCDLVGGNYRIKLIEWPCDVEIQNCQGQGNDIFDPENLPVNFEEDREPRFDDDHCSLMAASYEDTVFPAVDSVCVKVFRNWKVIDWCLYEQRIAGTYNGPYQWTFTQVIKMLNSDAPEIENCNDQTFCGNGPDCEGAIEIRPDISDDCTPLADLRIDYKIDLYNDGSFDLLGYSDNQASYPFPNPDNLPVTSFEADSARADGVYPVGTHRIFWGAEDGCGNANVCAYEFTVEDCKPPTAYCEIGISTIPMPQEAGGYIEIWASDFDLGSFDNCSAQENLTFTFSTDLNDKIRRLTCADAGQTIDYTIHVWDEAGNYSSCLVGVILTGCNGNSNDFMTIQTLNGEEIGNMQAKITGPAGQEVIVDLINGRINPLDLMRVTFLGPYKVEPYKNLNPENGVTTFDMVLITKHILAVRPLDSPYKILAADVNSGNTLTTLDMVDIRRMILRRIGQFPNNTPSWKFADASFDFPNPGNPFGVNYPDFIVTNRLDSLFGTFIGFKMGDVNQSANVGFAGDDTEDRSADPVYLDLEDTFLQSGKEYEVRLALSPETPLWGLQFALQIDPAAAGITGIRTGDMVGLNQHNFNTNRLDRGTILGSWSAAEAQRLSDETFITLTLRAKQDIRLSEILTLASGQLAAEAYTESSEDIDIHGLQIRFTEAPLADKSDYLLYGNHPNPFRDQTTIRFYQPESGLVSLQVYDALGRQVYATQASYDAGIQEITIDRSDLRHPGLYYFQLQSADLPAKRGSMLLAGNR